MREGNFPQTWLPSPENRDLRQLLWHRHRLVQMRTRIMNQLQALAMNEGKRWKSKLWSQQGEPSSRNLRCPAGLAADVESWWELFDRINPTIPRETSLLIPSKRGGNRTAKYLGARCPVCE
jgi:hypothetical protein